MATVDLLQSAVVELHPVFQLMEQPGRQGEHCLVLLLGHQLHTATEHLWQWQEMLVQLQQQHILQMARHGH